MWKKQTNKKEMNEKYENFEPLIPTKSLPLGYD